MKFDPEKNKINDAFREGEKGKSRAAVILMLVFLFPLEKNSGNETIGKETLNLCELHTRFLPAKLNIKKNNNSLLSTKNIRFITVIIFYFIKIKKLQKLP